MATRRFKPDPDFEMVMSRAASGLEQFTGRGNVRRRGTTLQFVADEIVKEAKAIVDNQVLGTPGLPGTVKGGRRNAGYDFRRSHGGRTYRASFKTRVETQGGRLVFVIYNDHAHAKDVEYGTGNGEVVKARPGEPFALPISTRAYNRIRKTSRAAFIGRNNQPVLYTKQFRTYRGYGILRRAMTTITRRYLRP